MKKRILCMFLCVLTLFTMLSVGLSALASSIHIEPLDEDDYLIIDNYDRDVYYDIDFEGVSNSDITFIWCDSTGAPLETAPAGIYYNYTPDSDTGDNEGELKLYIQSYEAKAGVYYFKVTSSSPLNSPEDSENTSNANADITSNVVSLTVKEKTQSVFDYFKSVIQKIFKFISSLFSFLKPVKYT